MTTPTTNRRVNVALQLDESVWRACHDTDNNPTIDIEATVERALREALEQLATDGHN